MPDIPASPDLLSPLTESRETPGGARIQVLLLMAGEGSRFRRGGYLQSKPLIPVDGRPMFEQALSGIDPIVDFDLVAVVREAQIADEAIDQEVRRTRPTARFAVLPRTTRGAAESALAAASVLDVSRPLIVLDCDLRFVSRRYVDLVRAMSGGATTAQVGLLTFPADDARYSYARTDGNGVVTEVAEKVVISGSAIAGAYLFARADLFLDAARRVVDGELNERLPEYYMSAVVQALIQDGAAAIANPVDEYESFGTPEELDSSMEVRRAR